MSFRTDLLKHPCFCRPFLGALFAALDYTDNDYYQLFSLCLIYAMQSNAGINRFEILYLTLICSPIFAGQGVA